MQSLCLETIALIFNPNTLRQHQERCLCRPVHFVDPRHTPRPVMAKQNTTEALGAGDSLWPDQVQTRSFQVQLSGKVVGGLVVSERLQKGALRLATSHQDGQLCGLWSVTSSYQLWDLSGPCLAGEDRTPKGHDVHQLFITIHQPQQSVSAGFVVYMFW